MLDIKRIREDYEHVKERVEFRGKGSFGLEKAKELDEKRRALLADVEAKKNKQNKKPSTGHISTHSRRI